MASTSTAASVAQTFLPFNGPLLVAANLVWVLYGCFLIQLFHYYSFHSCKDYWLKILVGVVAITGTLHVAFLLATQWAISVQHWGDPNIWAVSPWESSLGPLTSELNACIVQMFFVARILLISRHIAARIVAVLVCLTALLAMGGAIGITILFVRGGSHGVDLANLATVARLWIVSSLVADILIATTMAIILSQARSRTGFKATKHVLARLVYQSIETGAVTAVDMLLCLICYEVLQEKNSTYLIWDYAGGPLYGNVLLFVLNSRDSIRVGLHDTREIHSLSTITPPGAAISTRSVNTSVKVTTDVLKQYDSDAKNMDSELGGVAAYSRHQAQVYSQ